MGDKHRQRSATEKSVLNRLRKVCTALPVLQMIVAATYRRVAPKRLVAQLQD